MSEYLTCPCGHEYVDFTRRDQWRIVQGLRRRGIRLGQYIACCPDCFIGWLAYVLDRAEYQP